MTPYSDEEHAALERHIRAGRSQSETARRLNSEFHGGREVRTKHSLTGRVNRSGLGVSRATLRERQSSYALSRRRVANGGPQDENEVAPTGLIGGWEPRFAIVDELYEKPDALSRDEQSCAFILTDRPPHKYCGGACKSESSYCAEHHKVVFSKQLQPLDMKWLRRYL